MAEDPTLCIYHAHCLDGFAAALVVQRRFGDSVTFVAANYGSEPPDVLGQRVTIVDFSYKAPVMRDIARKAESVVVLDHHETAERELHPLFDEHLIAGEFDMGRSGALLAWEWYLDDPAPDLILAIDDFDRWRFFRPGTRQIVAALQSYPREFDTWSNLLEASRTPDGWELLIEEGRILMRGNSQQLMSWLPAVTGMMVIGGQRVPVANLPKFMGSEACEVLCHGPHPFSAYYFDRADGLREFGLRSRGPNAVNVARIAKTYGGGGHATAAGFCMPPGWEGDG